MPVRALLAVPSSVHWPLKSALGELGATVVTLDDLAKGLRATAGAFDLAILDGATKSLTLGWALGELKRRNAAVRLYTWGGAPRADAQALDTALAPDVVARQLLGAKEPVRDFEELGPRQRFDPCFIVEARFQGRAMNVVGVEGDELAERFQALAVGLTAVPACAALPPLLHLGRDERCAWAGFPPLAAGTSLSELGRLLRHERSRISLGTVAFLGLTVLDALEALHAAGLRHGLVRAQALWLAHDGEVLLRYPALGELIEGDRTLQRRSTFGTARRLDDLAPESLAAQPGTARTDLYQLGHLLYEELTARSPFRDFPHDRPVTPPVAHDPALPAQLSAVVEGLLAKDPRSRPPLEAVRVALAPHAGSRSSAAAEFRELGARLATLLS